MQNEKQFYSPKELAEAGLLPYQSEATIRRMVRNGQIKAVPAGGSRSHIHITVEEVERVRRGYNTQDISPQLESKGGAAE